MTTEHPGFELLSRTVYQCTTCGGLIAVSPSLSLDDHVHRGSGELIDVIPEGPTTMDILRERGMVADVPTREPRSEYEGEWVEQA